MTDTALAYRYGCCQIVAFLMDETLVSNYHGLWMMSRLESAFVTSLRSSILIVIYRLYRIGYYVYCLIKTCLLDSFLYCLDTAPSKSLGLSLTFDIIFVIIRRFKPHYKASFGAYSSVG